MTESYAELEEKRDALYDRLTVVTRERDELRAENERLRSDNQLLAGAIRTGVVGATLPPPAGPSENERLRVENERLRPALLSLVDAVDSEGWNPDDPVLRAAREALREG